jgi:hypothetical protein
MELSASVKGLNKKDKRKQKCTQKDYQGTILFLKAAF